MQDWQVNKKDALEGVHIRDSLKNKYQWEHLQVNITKRVRILSNSLCTLSLFP